LILSLIYNAVIIIVLLTFSFGPAFFALINTGIKFGYRTGSFLAIGVVLSDLFICLLVCVLVHFGMANLLQSEKTQTLFATIGGGILIVFGAFFFRKHPVKTDETIEIDKNQLPSPKLMLLKGFFLNLFNPTVWLLWLANVAAIGKIMEYSMIKLLLFFGLVLAAVLAVELSKVKLAAKIKHILTDKIMMVVNYITGTALIIFGMILIYNHYFNK
jgi:threonine/homoserine/homoserine lactone efflux protein